MALIRKIYQLILYVSSRRMAWGLPENVDIVILDETNIFRLTPMLDSNNRYVVIKNQSHLYFKYLFKAISIDSLLRPRKIILNYHIKMIRQINPKIVITNVDNSPLYWEIDREISNSINFLTIQNGKHLLGISETLPDIFKVFFLESVPYYSNFACFSQFDYDYYCKFGATIENHYVIGDIALTDYISEYTQKSKVFDICIIANSWNDQLSDKRMWDYILRFTKLSNYRVCVALKTSYDSPSFHKHIQDLNEYTKDTNIILVNRSKFSSHFLSDLSKVTIGSHTTFLRQTFARGNRIYPINFVDESMSPPYDLLNHSLSPSYEEFKLHLQNLIDVDSKTYQNKNLDNMRYFDSFDVNITPADKFKRIIKTFL